LETRNYELMFIAAPELAEDDLDAVLQRVQRYLESAEAQVASFKSWGLRRLAYSIKGQREGRYYLVQFTASPEVVNDLDRNLRLVEGVLRHLVTRVDELQVPESSPEPVMETPAAAPQPETADESSDSEPSDTTEAAAEA
jgi:small subunit ribosomal protein S6